MSMIKFLKGLTASLPAQSTEGYVYFTTDGHIHLGLADGKYKEYAEFHQVANIAGLPTAKADGLFYAKEENVLCVWGTKSDNTEGWVQINPDHNTTYTIEPGSANGTIKLVGSDNTSVEIAVTGLGTAAFTNADAYAPAEHGHEIADVEGLEDAIADAKKAGTDAQSAAETAQSAAEAAQKSADDAQGEVDALELVVGTLPEGETDVVSYINKKTSGIATDTALAELQGKVTANETAIGTLNGGVDVDGSVDKKIADKIATLDKADTAVDKQFVTAVSEEDGIITVSRKGIEMSDVNGLNDKVTEIEGNVTKAQETADAKVASVTAADKSVTVGGTSTAPTIAAKLSQDADNAIELVEDGLKVVIPAAAEYSVVKAETATDGYSATYHLTKDGVNVGAAINIPKDMVVQSGSVVVDPAGQEAGTYLKLVLANAENSEIFIPVSSLIEYVTSGSQVGDMVVVAIDENHKVTATITDGTITAAKLTTEVQTALNKAHVHENADVINGITADDVEAWNAAEQNAKDYAKEYADGLNTAMDNRVKPVEEKLATVAEGAQVNVIETVKVNGVALTPDENKAVDVTVPTGALASKDIITEAEIDEALAEKINASAEGNHSHANKDELDKFVDGDKAKYDEAYAKMHEHENKEVIDGITAEKVVAWDASEQNAKDYADGLLEWLTF